MYTKKVLLLWLCAELRKGYTACTVDSNLHSTVFGMVASPALQVLSRNTQTRNIDIQNEVSEHASGLWLRVANCKLNIGGVQPKLGQVVTLRC